MFVFFLLALYEEESDSELGSMENHGSVVTHLLSQVKIGMDLTKVRRTALAAFGVLFCVQG